MLPLLTGNEVKVMDVLFRHTYGFHVESVKMSQTELQRRAGISHEGLIHVLNRGLCSETGLVERTNTVNKKGGKGRNIYRIRVRNVASDGLLPDGREPDHLVLNKGVSKDSTDIPKGISPFPTESGNQASEDTGWKAEAAEVKHHLEALYENEFDIKPEMTGVWSRLKALLAFLEKDLLVRVLDHVYNSRDFADVANRDKLLWVLKADTINHHRIKLLDDGD